MGSEMCIRDSEEGYENALARMQAAGIDAVVAEYQSQLNAYLGK